MFKFARAENAYLRKGEGFTTYYYKYSVFTFHLRVITYRRCARGEGRRLGFKATFSLHSDILLYTKVTGFSEKLHVYTLWCVVGVVLYGVGIISLLLCSQDPI